MSEFKLYNDYYGYVLSHENNFGPMAAKSTNSEFTFSRPGQSKKVNIGDYSIKIQSYRTPFQIDLDMITYSKYSLKLHGKTQVFISPGDYQLVTRASHTEIVMNLAEDIARGLGLNTDLVKSIAKGHDIGHTAFGHAGEDALDEICRDELCYENPVEFRKEDPIRFNRLKEKYNTYCTSLDNLPVSEKLKNPESWETIQKEFIINKDHLHLFQHSKQALRFLCIFEGKRLTAQTMHGIISHKENWDTIPDWWVEFEEEIKRAPDLNPLREKPPDEPSDGYIKERYSLNRQHTTYEGYVVKYADFLAFAIHDLDDLLKSRILSFDILKEKFSKVFHHKRVEDYLMGHNRYARYINEFIDENTENVINGVSMKRPANSILPVIRKKIVVPIINNHPQLKNRYNEGKRYIRGLYDIWKLDKIGLKDKYPHLFDELRIEFVKGHSDIRQFCDFISALTDDEIIMVYRSFFGPEQG